MTGVRAWRDELTRGVAFQITSEPIGGQVQDLDFTGVTFVNRDESEISTAKPFVLLRLEAEELWEELGRVLGKTRGTGNAQIVAELTSERARVNTLLAIVDRLVT